jgi:hypothetical protein
MPLGTRARESITCLKKFGIHPIDHPSYSSHSAPSHFSLFGKQKDALAGQRFEFNKEFLWAISVVTDSTGRVELESAIDACEWRLSDGIQTKGEYITPGESESLGETTYSHRQTEMLKSHRIPNIKLSS